jgi:protein-L-isoaspartate(D-aspartate) O-methyltransferase
MINPVYIILVSYLILSSCGDSSKHNIKTNQTGNKYSQLRFEMVENQIKNRGVHDKLVLEAMQRVPRHEFVSPEYQQYAYRDHPLPIGEDQTISQPYIVAFMTEALSLKGTEKVLEIGTGSGYQTAILAEIVDLVYSIEIIPSLTERAAYILERLGYKNVNVRTGDGYRGWPELAPFDCIIVTAAPDHIPEPLIAQLKTGGRMIIPVGNFHQELILIEKEKSGKITKKSILPVRFVPMTGEAMEGIR